jgi:hypothetical protein
MYANVKVIGADESATTDGAAFALQATTVAARLFTVTAYNKNAETRYLQAHDAASEPGDTTSEPPVTASKPKLVTPVFAGLSGGFNFTDGTIFKNGIYLCWSSTDTVKTLEATTGGIIDATFRKQ